jgi:4-hydroxy-tetrahydrodipicolinate synthase
MKLDATAKGTFAIAPTPFREDGSIDEGSIDRMADFYVAAGCTGLTLLGIMGEAPKLDADEAIGIVRRVVGRIGSTIPIVVGVSAPGFAAIRSLARNAMDAGAAAVMIAPQPSLRTDDQIVAYFTQAIAAVGADVPWVLQDYPLTLSVVMTPDVIRRIVEANPSCVMLKHEDWPGLEKITRLRAMQAEKRLQPLSILTGNGGLFLDFEMERGADGAMTGYAFPELLIDVVRLSRSGERDQAHDLFDAHLPLIRYEQQLGIGLAVRKHVMALRGIIASPAQRAPATSLSATAKQEIAYLLARLARTDRRAEAAVAASTAR